MQVITWAGARPNLTAWVGSEGRDNPAWSNARFPVGQVGDNESNTVGPESTQGVNPPELQPGAPAFQRPSVAPTYWPSAATGFQNG